MSRDAVRSATRVGDPTRSGSSVAPATSPADSSGWRVPAPNVHSVARACKHSRRRALRDTPSTRRSPRLGPALSPTFEDGLAAARSVSTSCRRGSSGLRFPGEQDVVLDDLGLPGIPRHPVERQRVLAVADLEPPQRVGQPIPNVAAWQSYTHPRGTATNSPPRLTHPTSRSRPCTARGPRHRGTCTRPGSRVGTVVPPGSGRPASGRL